MLMSYVTGQVLDVCRPHTGATVTALIHCATTKTVLSFDSTGTIAVTHEVQCQFKPLRTRRIRAGSSDSSDGIVFAAYNHRLGLIATATADTAVTVWGFEYLEASANLALITKLLVLYLYVHWYTHCDRVAQFIYI